MQTPPVRPLSAPPRASFARIKAKRTKRSLFDTPLPAGPHVPVATSRFDDNEPPAERVVKVSDFSFTPDLVRSSCGVMYPHLCMALWCAVVCVWVCLLDYSAHAAVADDVAAAVAARPPTRLRRKERC